MDINSSNAALDSNPGWVNIIANQVKNEQNLLSSQEYERANNEPQAILEKSRGKKKDMNLTTQNVTMTTQKDGQSKKRSKAGNWFFGVRKELKARDTWNAVIGEFTAQAFLTWQIVLVNRVVTYYNTNQLASAWSVALGHTLSFGITFMIFFPISGCQANPAVTIGLWALGKLSTVRAVLTIPFQFAGSILAGGLALWCYPREIYNDITRNGANGPQTSFHEVFASEFGGTWIFMMSIIANAVDYRGMNYHYAAWQIATTLGYEIFLVAPSSSGSLNPFRTLGIAIVSNSYAFTWCIVLGNIAGALCAVLFYRNFFVDAEEEKKKEYYYKQEQHNKKLSKMLDYFKNGAIIPPGLAPMYQLNVQDWFMGEQNFHQQTIPFNEDQLYVVEFFTTNIDSMNFTCRILNRLLRQFNGAGYAIETAESENNPLVVYGITYDRTKYIRKWIEDNSPNYMIGRDVDGQGTLKSVTQLGIKYLPTCILIKDCSVIWMGNAANPELPALIAREIKAMRQFQAGHLNYDTQHNAISQPGANQPQQPTNL